jgi:hypothetical protein
MKMEIVQIKLGLKLCLEEVLLYSWKKILSDTLITLNHIYPASSMRNYIIIRMIFNFT